MRQPLELNHWQLTTADWLQGPTEPQATLLLKDPSGYRTGRACFPSEQEKRANAAHSRRIRLLSFFSLSNLTTKMQ